MAEHLAVELRKTRGKHNARRLRAAGQIPAVLYGHGLEPVTLSVPADGLDAAIRHGSRVVTFEGGLDEQAFIRELQWDTWGTHILHADFTRVSADEVIQVQVSLELRGEAPGVKEGGVVEQVLHEIEIECKATTIPEKIEVNINSLSLGESITLADLELPKGVRGLGSPEETVVHCVQPVETPEEAEEAVEGEPEVIGERKEGEEPSEE